MLHPVGYYSLVQLSAMDNDFFNYLDPLSNLVLPSPFDERGIFGNLL